MAGTTPKTTPAGRPGLTAEQDIRARALAAAVRVAGRNADLALRVADKFVEYITGARS